MHLPAGSIVASGPVIIEDGQVLLNKEFHKDHRGITQWLFPGGEVEDTDQSFEKACQREVKEEMGIEVDIIRPLKPILIRHENRVLILIHFLAKRRDDSEIKKGDRVVEWAWHDITNLPKDCAPNVKQVIEDLINADDSVRR